MKVFKFGGASVKDASAVRNVAAVLGNFPNEDIIVVISAIGKTTNALERVTNDFFYKTGNAENSFAQVKKYHFEILRELFSNLPHPVFSDVENIFLNLEEKIHSSPLYSFDKEYDQIVSLGEIISTKIISAYLNECGIKNKWLDARNFIKTDNTFREGKADWEKTEKLTLPLSLHKGVPSGKGEEIFITQGFIGGTNDNFSTTLGREGSDYSAAILAYCTNAESVTIWKDVPGVMNADPKWFDETVLIPQMSYQDAIELSYYGATVIHPKTIKPLQNKKISLFVKSFLQPQEKGTVINDIQSPLPIPCFIFKINQVLLSIQPKDFSFIVEENLSDIFKTFSLWGVKINMLQNSAISFSVCTDSDTQKIPKLIEELRKDFRVLYNEELELITIRYYDQPTIDRVCIGKKVLLEHKSRYTVQLVVKNV